MSTPDFTSLKRILAIRLDNIGDVVMLSPALRSLKQAFPEAQLSLMASPAGSQVAPLLPWVDDVFTWEAVWQDIAEHVPMDTGKEFALVDLLQQRHFDAAFIFTGITQSPHPPAYACYLAQIPIRIGQSREFGGGVFSHWVKPPKEDSYQVDRNLHLLEAVGIPVLDRRMALEVPAADQEKAAGLLAQLGLSLQPYVVLAPGASASARRYPEARFVQAAQQLALTGLPVVIIGSPREVGKYPRLEELAETKSLPIYSLIGRTTLNEMAAIISRSALVIANNSGSMHFAAAFNRPAVLLYSGTETHKQFAPPGAGICLLSRMTACTPCHLFNCPYHLECLDIPAEEVVAAALDLLKPGHSLSQTAGDSLIESPSSQR